MSGKLLRTDRPVRNRVSARVKELICARGLGPGDRLPSYQELTRELAISLVTVKRGLDDLEREGIIHRVPSSGTFVTRKIAQVPRALRHLGVIYPSTRALLFYAPYLVEIMHGVTQDAPPHCDMHIFSLREDGMIRAAQLGEWPVDGVILLGMENDNYLRTFAQWGLPGVVVDYCSAAAPLDYVACDNAAAARQVVDHLATLGHRRVAYVTGHSQQPVKNPGNLQSTLLVRDSSDVRERRAESVRQLAERGMLAGDWTPSDPKCNWITAAADHVHRLRRSASRPTALLTDNNSGASALIAELTRRGLRVPEDISVCAVASDGSEAAGERPLTCCRFDFNAMGRKAIALLSERRRTKPLESPCVHRIGFAFQEGQTAGPVTTSQGRATPATQPCRELRRELCRQSPSATSSGPSGSRRRCAANASHPTTQK